MGSGSVNALHVALAAAVVGWLVFSLSHAVAVWKRRSGDSAGRRTYGVLIVALLLCVVGLIVGWLNRELTRRAGVIAGTDFFVVRAHAGATAHLTSEDRLVADTPMVTYDSPEANRAAQRLRDQIAVLDEQMRIKALQPLTVDPELVRVAEERSDTQRARLAELGFGALNSSDGSAQLLAAQRAKSDAAELTLARTRSLVHDGVLPRQQLDGAVSAAASAAQELRERQHLIEDASTGSSAQRQSELAIHRDGARAGAERAADLAELTARSTELRDDLVQLIAQQAVKAPFDGTVVYRHPSPALAGPGVVILALARGVGFLATVEVPAREAAMMHAGQTLPMKLQHSLVSQDIKGRLVSVQTVADEDGRADLLIACNLPREQFAAFSSGSVPVILQWRPSLLTDPLARAGLALGTLFAVLWVGMQVFAWSRTHLTRPATDEVDRVLAQLEPVGDLNSGARR